MSAAQPLKLPLNGIRVLELGSNVAGPYGTWILAELGAEVWKVERPDGGDDARGWGPPFWQEVATVFHAINRNKRSVALDLKDGDAVERLRGRVASDFDVVLQRPGYDALMQAFGGVMSVTGEEGRPPVRAGISAIDMGTGMWCAIGILAALNRRHESGRGGTVDASLFETAVAWTAYYNTDVQVTGQVPTRQGSGVRGITPYQAYECADGWLVVAASNDRLFVRLAGALGHPDWAEEARFASNAERTHHRDELNTLLQPLFLARPRAYWQGRLDEAGVPNAPIQHAGEVVAHAQTKALGILQDSGRGVALTGLPLSFDGERPPLDHVAPALGADTAAVFADTGE